MASDSEGQPEFTGYTAGQAEAHAMHFWCFTCWPSMVGISVPTRSSGVHSGHSKNHAVSSFDRNC